MSVIKTLKLNLAVDMMFTNIIFRKVFDHLVIAWVLLLQSLVRR